MANRYQQHLRQPNTDEHPFAQYVRILGKGKTGSRSLTREEARSAMCLILQHKVEDVQLGAFLMLLRVKEESPEELTGFVEAVRESIQAPAIAVDLDWSSYAGKKKQLPYFLLSCWLLAGQGIRVFMHGTTGHTVGRLYTENVLTALNIPIATEWQQVEQHIQQRCFAFMPLEYLCPTLQGIINLRNTLGLRSPVHTLSRLINPLHATCSMQSIFHPGYANSHQRAAHLLGQVNAAVFKGEGGEIERKPEAVCVVQQVVGGEMQEELWPKLLDGRQEQPHVLAPEQLLTLWRGELGREELERREVACEYGELAVIGTAAIALKLLGKADSQAAAMTLATQLWQQRDRTLLDQWQTKTSR